MVSRRLVIAAAACSNLVLVVALGFLGPGQAGLPPPPFIPPSECAVLGNQPIIGFSLAAPPDGIFPADSVTLRWDVRYRGGRPWDREISLRTEPPDMRRSTGIPERLREPSGSHTFTGSWRTPAIIRLETRCGSQEVRYTPVAAPILDELSPVRPGIGERIHLRGRGFGTTGEVQVVVGERRTTMPVHSWTNMDIEVSVPSGAPVGSGYIHLFKGRGRLQSNSRAIRIVRILTINRGFLQSVRDMLV